jgi:hypothetical protein
LGYRKIKHLSELTMSCHSKMMIEHDNCSEPINRKQLDDLCGMDNLYVNSSRLFVRWAQISLGVLSEICHGSGDMKKIKEIVES